MCLSTTEIFDIIKSISIISASIVAVYGINSWRREARWKRKYELSEMVLTSFYEAQQSLRIMRFPSNATNEGKTRNKLDKETLEESRINDTAYVVFERYEKNKQIFEKIRFLKFQFIALFGKQHERIFNEFLALVNQVLNASQRIAELHIKDTGLSIEEKDKELLSCVAILYASCSSNRIDPIDQQVNILISEIEGVCGKIIRRK